MKKFLIWAGAMLVLWVINPSLGLWSIIISGIIWGSDTESSSGSSYSVPYTSGSSESNNYQNTSGYRGAGYNPGGDVEYYPGGNSSVRYGDVVYYSNNIHSVKQGNITYYSDDNGRRLGRSVDNGNGVFYYYDDDGREIGHSYTSGRITDFIGDCFECR